MRLRSILLSIFILVCLAVSLLNAAPLVITAEATNATVQAGGSTGTGGASTQGGSTGGSSATTNYSPPLSSYLEQIYLWFLGFVGIALLWAFVFGGVKYMLAGTSITSTSAAKQHIINGLWGIAIAASSVVILKIINPDLVNHGFDIEGMIQSIVSSIPR